MLTFDEAVARLVEAGRDARRELLPATEKIPATQALGRILARPMVSSVDVPPRANSAMDGYAFRYNDAVAAGFKLPVSQRIPAGKAPDPLQPGSAARIFTGAEIPQWADTVAMQEDCTADDAGVTIDSTQVEQGDNVRPRGQDITAGTTILQAGVRLRPQEIGLLFSVGEGMVEVYRPLRVAVLSTGDELVEPGQELAPGQIYNSNRATLIGLLTAWGMAVVDLGIVRDQPALIEVALARAAEEADVIVTSGGVSVGEEDHVKSAVEKLGSLGFWKIAIKPGKPLAFGRVAGKPFIGLPGNPASTFVTGLLFLRPFLLSVQGLEQVLPVFTREISLFGKRPVKRQEFIRARRTESGVESYTNQSSGVLSSACWGDGLVVQSVGEEIAPGDTVRFIPYSEFF